MLSSPDVKELGRRAGFDIVRIADASPFTEHVAAVEERRARGEVPAEMESAYPNMGHPRSRSDPRTFLPEARSIIILGVGYYIPLDGRSSVPGRPRGRLPRNAWRDLSDLMSKMEGAFILSIEERGVKCARGGDLPLKRAAARGGLGGYARSGGVHAEVYGPWVQLSAVVVDAPLDPDPAVEVNCGTCQRCMAACPAKAITAPYVVNGSRCLAHVLSSPDWIPEHLRPAVGDRIWSCDLCLEVCPRALNPMVAADRAHDRLEGWTAAPELLPLLGAGDGELRAHFSYLDPERFRPDLLRRNAIVALGNSRDPLAVPALIGMLGSREASLRGHAAWALGRIGGEEAAMALEKHLQSEGHGRVRGEITTALACLKP